MTLRHLKPSLNNKELLKLTPLASMIPPPVIHVHKETKENLPSDQIQECRYCDHEVPKTRYTVPACLYKQTMPAKVLLLKKRFKGKRQPARIQKQIRRLTKFTVQGPPVYIVCSDDLVVRKIP